MLGVIRQAITGLAMQAAGPGFDPAGIALYFRGDESAVVSAEPDPFGLSAPEDMATTMALPKTFHTLLEVAHWHLAIIPILVFLAVHCCGLCRWGRNRVVAVVSALTVAGAVAVIAAPFLVLYGHAAFSWLQLASVLILDGGLVLLALVTIASCLRPGDKPAAHA